jgi:predicted dehydrogenase
MTNHVLYSYRGSWVANGLSTPWESAWRLIGDNGTVTWDGEQTFRAQVVAEKKGRVHSTRNVDVPLDPAALPLTGHAGCIDEFIQCILTGRTPQTVCTDNIKSLAMVHAAIAAADQGQRVACEDR